MPRGRKQFSQTQIKNGELVRQRKANSARELFPSKKHETQQKETQHHAVDVMLGFS